MPAESIRISTSSSCSTASEPRSRCLSDGLSPSTFLLWVVKSSVVVDDNFTAYNRLPSNLTVYQHGTHNFGDAKGNHIEITAQIIAPQAAFVAKNNAVIRRSVTFKTIEFKNNADLYYDETQGS